MEDKIIRIEQDSVLVKTPYGFVRRPILTEEQELEARISEMRPELNKDV